MLKSLLFVFVLYSSIFAEENITGLFGFKLNQPFLEKNVLFKGTSFEGELIDYTLNISPEPFTFLSEFYKEDSFGYVVSTNLDNNIVKISGGFSSASVTNSNINSAFFKIKELKRLIEKKYNVSFNQNMFYSITDGDLTILDSFERIDNASFSNMNEYHFSFKKDGCIYKILFSYAESYILFNISVEDEKALLNIKDKSTLKVNKSI